MTWLLTHWEPIRWALALALLAAFVCWLRPFRDTSDDIPHPGEF